MTEQKKYSNKVVSVLMLVFGVLSLYSAIRGIFTASGSLLPSSIAEIVSCTLFALTGAFGLIFLKNSSKYGLCKTINWLSIAALVISCIMVCMVIPSMPVPAGFEQYAQYEGAAKIIVYCTVIGGTVIKLIFNLLYFRGIKKNENI